jgi:hypothetical protein
MPSIDEELGQIERDIRTLKIEYEQFFGGGRKRPPSDTQWRLENLIRRYAERMGDLNYGQRFRYNNLTQTYAKYQDMWRKKLVQKEMGTPQHHFGAAAKEIEAARRSGEARSPSGVAERERRAHREDARGPEKIEELYRKLMEARKQTGEEAFAPSFADFERFVEQKTRELQRKGAQQVEFTVAVEGGRVKLKAKVAN